MTYTGAYDDVIESRFGVVGAFYYNISIFLSIVQVVTHTLCLLVRVSQIRRQNKAND